jgi:hypothetical protein
VRSRPALTSNPRTAQPHKASRESKPIHRLAAAVVAVWLALATLATFITVRFV